MSEAGQHLQMQALNGIGARTLASGNRGSGMRAPQLVNAAQYVVLVRDVPDPSTLDRCLANTSDAPSTQRPSPPA